MSGPRRRLTLVCLLAAAVLPYFVGLGQSAIWDANEAFYVETPREMIEAGDYVSPTFNYVPRLNKPVLSYWIVAGFYSMFGVSVGVERLAIALGGIGLIAVAFGLAWLACPGDRQNPYPRLEASLWAAIGLAIAPRLLMFSRRIFIDIYISLFMALTLLCFAAAERYPTRRRPFLALMYVAVGLGVLTKGPVAAVVPGLVFGVYLLVHRELGRAKRMMIPAGLLIVLAIVGPWYAALYARDGWTNIVSFFVGENVDRFTSGLGVRVERGPLYYIPVLFSDSFPVSLYLLHAAWLWLRGGRAALDGSPGARIRTLLWLWIFVIVGFFSLSAGKQDLYIFPVVPAVVAIAACLLVGEGRAADGDSRASAGVVLTTQGVGGLLVIIGAALVYAFRAAGAEYAIAGVGAIGAIGITSGVLVIWRAGRAPAFTAPGIIAVAFVALNAVFVQVTLPSFEAYKPVPAFADAIRRRAGPADVVATYEQAMPSLVYYLRRHVVEIFDEPALFETLRSGPGVYAVMSADDYMEVRSRAPGVLCEVARRPTFDVRLRNVLAREPLPELVLVTNRCNGAN